MINVTVHAQQRMASRGLTLPDVVNAIKDGDKRRSKYGSARHVWCSATPSTTAVYAIEGEALTVLTAY